MSIINDPVALALSRSLFLLSDAKVRARGILADIEHQKQATIKDLGEVIIRCVESHGTFVEAEDKSWHRSLRSTRFDGKPGFMDLIKATHGAIDWNELYLPALTSMDRSRVRMSQPTKVRNREVSLNEKLTLEEKEAILASRLQKPST